MRRRCLCRLRSDHLLVCDCFQYTLNLEESVQANLEMEEEVVSDEILVEVDLSTFYGQDTELGSPHTSEPVEDVDPATERLSIGGVVSKRSKADYAVYTLGGGTMKRKVVAIIDAKRRITPHAVAQIIGYYSAFDITDIQPLVLILTAHQLKIVIFPFRTGEHHLINAVAFHCGRGGKPYG